MLNFNDFVLEAYGKDYSEKITHCQFLRKCQFELKSEIPPSIVESVFFWKEIFQSSGKSFYDSQRIGLQDGTKRRLGHLRLSDHWNWIDSSGIIHSPLKNKEIKSEHWIIAKWVDNSAQGLKKAGVYTDSSWRFGFVKKIDEMDSWGFVKPLDNGKDVFLDSKWVLELDLNIGDYLFFKAEKNYKGEAVIDIILSDRIYDPLIVGVKGSYKSQLANIYKQILISGDRILAQLLRTSDNNNKLSILIGSDLKQVDKVIKKDWNFNKFSVSFKDVLQKPVIIDDEVFRADYKVKMQGKTFECINYSLTELKVELYRLKRTVVDKDLKFDFTL